MPEFSRPRALKADASLSVPPKAEASHTLPPEAEASHTLPPAAEALHTLPPAAAASLPLPSAGEGWGKGCSGCEGGSANTGLPSCTCSLRLDQRLKNPSVIVNRYLHCPIHRLHHHFHPPNQPLHHQRHRFRCHLRHHFPHRHQTSSRSRLMPDCQTGPSAT